MRKLGMIVWMSFNSLLLVMCDSAELGDVMKGPSESEKTNQSSSYGDKQLAQSNSNEEAVVQASFSNKEQGFNLTGEDSSIKPEFYNFEIICDEKARTFQGGSEAENSSNPSLRRNDLNCGVRFHRLLADGAGGDCGSEVGEQWTCGEEEDSFTLTLADSTGFEDGRVAEGSITLSFTLGSSSAEDTVAKDEDINDDLYDTALSFSVDSSGGPEVKIIDELPGVVRGTEFYMFFETDHETVELESSTATSQPTAGGASGIIDLYGNADNVHLNHLMKKGLIVSILKEDILGDNSDASEITIDYVFKFKEGGSVRTTLTVSRANEYAFGDPSCAELEKDECGVCNGDGTSCADCAGEPNGDAEEDCAGECNGDAVVDDCGVCGGSNDCIPLGPMTLSNVVAAGPNAEGVSVAIDLTNPLTAVHVGEGVIEIYYDHTWEFVEDDAGDYFVNDVPGMTAFQFDLLDLRLSQTLLGCGGGIVQALNDESFTIQWGVLVNDANKRVVGSSQTATPIPSGSGLLTVCYVQE